MNAADATAPRGGRGRRGRAQPPRPGARPAEGTKPADTAGGGLERRVARLEFAEGALARLRVPVPADDADPGRDVLTDMDVLSVDVDLRLRMSRSSLECKSGRGQSGEPMTLVWLAGFRQLLGLDRVVLVRPAVSTRGRALARRLGIGVLDETTVASREAAQAWLPQRFAHLDGPACADAESRTDRQLRGMPDMPTPLADFLRHRALLADSPALLAAVHALGSAAARQGILPEPAGTVLAGHALVAVVLAGLQDARRLDEMSPRLLRTRLERGVTTGDPDDDRLLALLERADALVLHVVERTHRAYVAAGADPIRAEIPSLRETVAAPPDYLDDYLDMAARLRANPIVARDLLQTVELACFEAALGGDAWRAPAFAHLFTPEHQGLLLVALRCLGRVAGQQLADHLHAITGLPLVGGGRVPDRRHAPDQPPPSMPSPAGALPAGHDSKQHQASSADSNPHPAPRPADADRMQLPLNGE